MHILALQLENLKKQTKDVVAITNELLIIQDWGVVMGVNCPMRWKSHDILKEYLVTEIFNKEY